MPGAPHLISPGVDRVGRPGGPAAYPGPSARTPEPEVSKKTKKRKLNARRKKANHGRRPNAGRR